MGRNKLYTEKEFKKAYNKAKSVVELAGVLNITIPTVYNYITRYKTKLYHPSKANTLDPVELGKMYVFDVTIEDIAQKLKVSKTSVYYCLRKLILYPKRYTLTPNKKEPLSPPKKLGHIKIINLIRKHLKYIDCPWPMVKLPGITEEMVDDYYRHAFGYELKLYEKGEE